MKPKEELGYKENEMLAAFLTNFKIRKREKLFWQLIMGKTGRRYKNIKEIPENEQAEIAQFLQKLEKDGTI
jgi:hypothetical protein